MKERRRRDLHRAKDYKEVGGRACHVWVKFLRREKRASLELKKKKKVQINLKYGENIC